MRRVLRPTAQLLALSLVCGLSSGLAATSQSEVDAWNAGRVRLLTRATKHRNRQPCDPGSTLFASSTGQTIAGTPYAPSAARDGAPGDASAAPLAFDRPVAQACQQDLALGTAASNGAAFAVLRELLQSEATGLRADSDLTPVLCSMLDRLHEGLLVCDAGGAVFYVNESLCRTLNRTSESLVGRCAFDIFPGLGALLTDRADATHFETEWQGSADDGKYFKVSVLPVVGGTGDAVGFFAVVRDFSRRKRAEIALLRARSECRLLSAQLLLAHEAERRRIARGLHDGIQQCLGGIKFGLETCVARLCSDQPHAEAAPARDLVIKVQAAIEEIRRIAMGLHPSVLDHLGVCPTIEWFCREFNATYRDVHLDTQVEVCEDEIPPSIKLAVYRIVQEAANNAVKHARANRVTLTLRHDHGHIELAIRDNGVGFDQASVSEIEATGRGLGLASMRERAEATAGRFLLESRPGCGTVVRVSWPSHCRRSARVCGSESCA